ncbi:LOW QUALITY PROTEIN: lymphatic vessel endothelial hyaluronic receptor 1b [Cebidichthys violaceus]|uniref:LOW QUALITY PROTEIN: lymphatic vessel endothelial hyaluronic receptor 1b n=1 Tax=Cebidichthys violaceus TaxID=271503 RepID=UPI0035CB930B
MERFRFCTRCLLFSFAACLLASNSNLIKVPQRPGAAGVFLLMEGGGYTFDLAAARAACLALNVTVASRAQMERAVRLGLQTCKFGWIAEQIAVVPRLTADSKCGNGKTGVVTWSARADRKFGVFCFNASDLEETPDRSTASPQSSTLTALTRTWTPSRPSLRSATESPPPRKPGTRKAPERTPFTSASTLRIQTTHSARVSSTSPTPMPPSAHVPTSISQLVKSEATVVSLVFSTSAHASGFSLSSESAMPQSTGSAKPPLGNVPAALIVLGVIVLLLTAAGVVWYYKLNIFTFRSQEPQKDDIETEMWKQTDSEVDLHSQHEGEDEEDDEEDRKYSSDITLCVNPDFKTNSSE